MTHDPLDALADRLHALAGAAFALARQLGPDRDLDVDLDGALCEAPPPPLDAEWARQLEALPAQIAGVMATLARDGEARRRARAHARLVASICTLDAHLRRYDPEYDDAHHGRASVAAPVRHIYALREIVEMLDDELVVVVDLPTGEVTRCRARALRSNFELMTALEGPNPRIEDEQLMARHDYFTWHALTHAGGRLAADRMEHRLLGDDRPRDIPRFEGHTAVIRTRTTPPSRWWRTSVVKPLHESLRGGLEVEERLRDDDAMALLTRMAAAAEVFVRDTDDPFDRALAESVAPRSFLLPTGPEAPAHCHFGVSLGLEYLGRLYNGFRPLVVMPPKATRLYFDDVKRQEALLRALLDSRYARTVERLVIGTTTFVNDDELHGDDATYHTADFDAVIALLAQARLPALKSLHLGAHKKHHNAHLNLVGSLGDLAPVLDALSHLEELGLYGRFELSAPVALPALRRLDVAVADNESNRGPLSNETLHRLLTVRAPALTVATVRLNGYFDDEVPAYTFPSAFLEGEGLPSLREILIYGKFSPDEARRLRGSPLAQRARIDF